MSLLGLKLLLILIVLASIFNNFSLIVHYLINRNNEIYSENKKVYVYTLIFACIIILMVIVKLYISGVWYDYFMYFYVNVCSLRYDGWLWKFG